MLRRNFLKRLSALALVPVLGKLPVTPKVAKVAKVAEPWVIDKVTGNIRWVGGNDESTTVLELHRWLQDKADSEYGVGDDLCITDASPSDRCTDQLIRLNDSYNIDEDAAGHLYDGSIIQGSGDTEEIFYGVVNFGTAGAVAMDLYQNGVWVASDEGSNPDPEHCIANRFMIKGHNQKRDDLVAVCRETGKEFHINGLSGGNNCLAVGV